MKEILITGGAGFIGSNLAEAFVSAGHSITVLDDFIPYYSLELKERNVQAARSAEREGRGKYKLVRGDVRDYDIVEKLMENVDYVFHHAAQAGVRTSLDQPQKVNSINVEGTLNILEAARRTGIERVINASSSSVYGKKHYLPYDEDHPTEPVSPYGASKLAAEHYARIYWEVYDLPTVSLRYFTVYGRRMRPDMAISNFVSRCLNGEPPVVYGDGTQTRDFTHVNDIVRANSKLLTTSSADGEELNIGSSDNIKIIELAKFTRDELAPQLEVSYSTSNTADANHTHADVSKAANLIDYQPTINIKGGVRMYIDWYLENRDWFEPLIRNTDSS